MSKVLVIPDIHHSTHWQKFFDGALVDAVDEIVQLGDWFDAWEPDWTDDAPLKNFEKAFELRKSYPNFTILIGNHDSQYITGDSCSGRQAYHSRDIKNAILSHLDEMKIAHCIDGWVFSHAGITKTWMGNNGLMSVADINNAYMAGARLREYIGECTKFNPVVVAMKKFRDEFNVGNFFQNDNPEETDRLYAEIKDRMPGILKKDSVTDDEIVFFIKKTFNAFLFTGLDCYGDDVTQSPLWVRPRSLVTDQYFDKQCVGHTEIGDSPMIVADDETGQKIVVIDTPKHDVAIILDTETDEIKTVRA
jgi:hypothetical protein